LARSAERVAVAELIAELPERERTILHRRFFDGLSQREIAEELGISQMHVSRLLRRTLRTVRSHLSDAAAAAE
ncbi:MAG: sigma-70 family RNA polymerase sigma factor, partial [Acidobacteria bacterium]|nr:sigma-70 family RNA polymerase sigma factor [Acidobacteriota bacterium]